MADFTIKKGDRKPPLLATLRQGDGTPQDLTGATVTFSMTLVPGDGNPPKVNNGSCTIVGSAVNGQVSYAWGATDTDTPGSYKGEFHVAFPGGLNGSWPSDQYLIIEVEQRV